MVKILIVSDTHGDLKGFYDVVNKETFDYLIHCGDIIDDVEIIKKRCDKCYIVAGNNDYFSDLEDEILVDIDGVKFFITHGHFYNVYFTRKSLLEKAKEKSANIVLYGHTHIPFLEKKDDIILLNPGSLTYPRQSPRKKSYAMLVIEDSNILSVEVKYIE